MKRKACDSNPPVFTNNESDVDSLVNSLGFMSLSDGKENNSFSMNHMPIFSSFSGPQIIRPEVVRPKIIKPMARYPEQIPSASKKHFVDNSADRPSNFDF